MRGAKTGVIPPRHSPPCKYMYRYVGHVVPAIEKSDLDQVLSRKRPSSRRGSPFGVVFARCASPFVSPDSAGVGLGRARVVSLRRVLFSFFW